MDCSLRAASNPTDLELDAIVRSAWLRVVIMFWVYVQPPLVHYCRQFISWNAVIVSLKFMTADEKWNRLNEQTNKFYAGLLTTYSVILYNLVENISDDTRFFIIIIASIYFRRRDVWDLCFQIAELFICNLNRTNLRRKHEPAALLLLLIRELLGNY